MEVSEYLVKIKAATNSNEIDSLLTQAIVDDDISAKDYGKVKNAVVARKNELSIGYTGRKIQYDN